MIFSAFNVLVFITFFLIVEGHIILIYCIYLTMNSICDCCQYALQRIENQIKLIEITSKQLFCFSGFSYFIFVPQKNYRFILMNKFICLDRRSSFKQ